MTRLLDMTVWDPWKSVWVQVHLIVCSKHKLQRVTRLTILRWWSQRPPNSIIDIPDWFYIGLWPAIAHVSCWDLAKRSSVAEDNNVKIGWSCPHIWGSPDSQTRLRSVKYIPPSPGLANAPRPLSHHSAYSAKYWHNSRLLLLICSVAQWGLDQAKPHRQQPTHCQGINADRDLGIINLSFKIIWNIKKKKKKSSLFPLADAKNIENAVTLTQPWWFVFITHFALISQHISFF